jgi:hypothetical protein
MSTSSAAAAESGKAGREPSSLIFARQVRTVFMVDGFGCFPARYCSWSDSARTYQRRSLLNRYARVRSRARSRPAWSGACSFALAGLPRGSWLLL